MKPVTILTLQEDSDRAEGFDLLGLRPIRGLVRWPGFPYAFQAAMLVLFVALAVVGWGRYAPEFRASASRLC